jgi:hypothetical protein
MLVPVNDITSVMKKETKNGVINGTRNRFIGAKHLLIFYCKSI